MHLDATPQSLRRETAAIWEAKAAFWDERMGEGNLFHRELNGPAIERLLHIQPGERVLEVACGNGQLARRLAALGARVTAVDISPTFLECARARTVVDQDRIDYHLVDAAESGQLHALGHKVFAAVVCSMALMDMPEIDPFLSTLPALLADGGRFVFSIQHPCFNSNATSIVGEIGQSGADVPTFAVKVYDYVNVPPGKGMGMPGEPMPHYYFHRPLGTLLAACFRVGLVLDGMEEPTLPPDVVATGPLAWARLPQIPPVLVARLRLATHTAD